MINVRADFDARAKEVDNYFDFIASVLSARSGLSYIDDTGAACAINPTSELEKTLKANGFLLIYNLVESTMSNVIEAVFDEIESQALCFDDLSTKMRLIILRNAKRISPENMERSFTLIATDIVKQTFKKDELFSGNVDAKRIRDTMRMYGINLTHRFNGSCLLTVKTNRNDLAHGRISFSECGKDYTVTELITFKDDAIEYLRATISDFESFLLNGEHKK